MLFGFMATCFRLTLCLRALFVPVLTCLYFETPFNAYTSFELYLELMPEEL